MDNLYPDYFDWLCEQIYIDGRYTDESYWELAKILFDTPFEFSLAMDGNREMDALDLRAQYQGEDRFFEEATVLEVLIALAQRIENLLDELDGEDRSVMYFWEMMDNLGLTRYSDNLFRMHPKARSNYIHQIVTRLERWMNRDIDYDGHGGLFPLRNPKRDQRDVDIWYQASAYMLENYT